MIQSQILSDAYRKDIDGIRAIAVMAVILFHFGYLPNGYLGVDVFFVISGYLITKIIFKEINQNRFSITQFYLRRTRRIIPLVLFINALAILIGICVMLPDDLENLCQSVVSTNLFSNNILQYVTTGNYWDVSNEFKPLMHTWSLGIEEQFYLVYPVIFIIFSKRIRWILPILVALTLLSLLIFFTSHSEPSKFYLLPSRFFELSLGGMASIILKDRVVINKFKSVLIGLLFLFLFIDINLPQDLKLFLTILLTVGVLISAGSQDKISTFILENKLMIWIGKISFSLYMWHQLILAFARYFVFESFGIVEASGIFILIVILSYLSYSVIEQPFRNKNKIKNSVLLWITGIAFVLTTIVSLYIYQKGGIIKDIPELGIKMSEGKRKMHSAYNDKIYKRDVDFISTDKIKILVIGNSFARDWSNVLLESKYKDSIEVAYIYDIDKSKNVNERLGKADYIFFSNRTKAEFGDITKNYTIDTTKVWMLGTKNFGVNNGIYYNRRGNPDYCSSRVAIAKTFLDRNDSLKMQWKNKFVDIIGRVIDKDKKMPVFTPDCEFISQDCRHFTKSGAIYFSQFINDNSLVKIKK
jgi:peptidoglycan/LPS O-acetylase OafA/YrhL